MEKVKRTRLIIAISIGVVLCGIIIYMLSNNSAGDIPDTPALYAGQSLIEWNGRIYQAIGSSAEYPYLKRGKDLGLVEGVDGLRAYAVKKEIKSEYLLICTEGLMREQVVYKLKQKKLLWLQCVKDNSNRLTNGNKL